MNRSEMPKHRKEVPWHGVPNGDGLGQAPPLGTGEPARKKRVEICKIFPQCFGSHQDYIKKLL